MSKTTRDDDYLICRHYKEHINNVSSEYKDFITFEHNDNHFFAWVNDGKIIMRSEAYPDHERMIRGIKAILKNRDKVERYGIESSHGAHFLYLMGGGSNAHTGGFENHNEIGRSCPVKDKDDLLALMGFMGPGFTKKLLAALGGGAAAAGSGAAKAAAATGAAALAATGSAKAAGSKKKAAATTSYAASSSGGSGGTTTGAGASTSGGGFNWKWLLPLLLLIPLFMWWKGCFGGDKNGKAATKVEQKAKVTKPDTKTASTDAALNAGGSAEADAAAAKIEAERKAAEAKEKARVEAEARAKKAKEEADRKRREERERAQLMRGNKNSGF